MSFDLLDDEDVPPRPHQRQTPPLAPPSPAAGGRTQPHSLEAEEFLLSCCLLDGADVVARCLEARIRPESFYDPKHGIIFDVLLLLHTQQKPIEVSVVAEELKATRQLDAVGGYAFLSQVSSRIPTTAQAGYFIEKVREQALLRQIIRSATGAVEDCYGFTGGIDEFAAQVRDRIEQVIDGSSTSDFNALEFDYSAKVPEARCAYYLLNTPTSRAGNLTTIVAAAKAGKSATIGALLAAAMTDNPHADCLGFSGMNTEGGVLLHYDTEQSKEDWHGLVVRAMKRADVNQPPKWLKSYRLKGKPRPEKRAIMERTLRAATRHGEKVFAIIIDGVADMVVDVNDPEESFGFIERLEQISEKHACPVICVIHLNPGDKSLKSRGHLGSELERKAESNIILEKDDEEVTVVYAPKQRKKAVMKPDGPRFHWNADREMHTLVANWASEAAAKKAEQVRRAKEKSPTAYSEVYSREEQVSFYPASGERSVPHAIIRRRAQEKSKISDRTLDRMRLQFLKDGWIVDVDDGYRRTREGDDWANRRPGAATNIPPPVQVEF